MDSHKRRAADAGLDTKPDDWETGDDEIVTVGERWADVVSVRVSGPLTLFVEHEDGVKGEVRFLESHLRGVFEKLRDPAFFNRVGIMHGAVSWPNEEVDLAPDNMYLHLKRDGEWVLQ